MGVWRQQRDDAESDVCGLMAQFGRSIIWIGYFFFIFFFYLPPPRLPPPPPPPLSHTSSSTLIFFPDGTSFFPPYFFVVNNFLGFWVFAFLLFCWRGSTAPRTASSIPCVNDCDSCEQHAYVLTERMAYAEHSPAISHARSHVETPRYKQIHPQRLFAIHHSPFTIRRSPFAVRRSPSTTPFELWKRRYSRV